MIPNIAGFAWKAAKGAVGMVKDHIADEGQLKIIEAKLATTLETELLERDQLQAKINLADSRARSFIQSSWRPMIGHYCGFGFAYSIFLPLLNWTINWANNDFSFPIPNLPAIDTSQLIIILMGMLGMGGLRTYEKKQKIDAGRVGENNTI